MMWFAPESQSWPSHVVLLSAAPVWRVLTDPALWPKPNRKLVLRPAKPRPIHQLSSICHMAIWPCGHYDIRRGFSEGTRNGAETPCRSAHSSMASISRSCTFTLDPRAKA
jgi:hypothetical protein